eukprot:TRINITY_DN61769_c0_g1_i1.p2 TRINITY_DN61769_c0_g1~~TRINITY_DN61769_c0_g1_i1.p2  ORF type:complete len:166 (+),score=90.32 TRINITY_DN61769_c0_g1_i1:25-498(+)
MEVLEYLAANPLVAGTLVLGLVVMFGLVALMNWISKDGIAATPLEDQVTDDEWNEELRDEFKMLCAEGNIKRTKGMVEEAEREVARYFRDQQGIEDAEKTDAAKFSARVLVVLKEQWGAEEALEQARSQKDVAHCIDVINYLTTYMEKHEKIAAGGK